MPNKTRVWSAEELENLMLVDATSRPIKGSDVVPFYCRECKKIIESKLSNIIDSVKRGGKNQLCKDCYSLVNSERGKKLIGNKNPFYGKKHKKEVREKIQKVQRNKWDNTDQQEKDEIGKQIRKAAQEKFGGNPMTDPKAKLAHKKAITGFFRDKNKVIAWEDKRKKTCLDKYGVSNFIESEQWFKVKADNRYFTSKAEIELIDWLTSIGVSAIKRRIGGEEVDVFIESSKLGIEMHGLYFHSEARISNDKHHKKYITSKNNGFKLLQIFSNEWETRKPQILNRILSLLGINQVVIGARKCETREVSHTEARPFFEQNHIQGYKRGNVLIVGLYHENKLVSAASFGHHHRDKNKMTLNRFCCLGGYRIIGALSKITKNGSEKLKQDLYTWCDLRWTDGSSYIASGWTQDLILDPDYFYIKNGRHVISKQSRKKSNVHTPDGMTERQHALQDGLLRVYDAGKIRFFYQYKEKPPNN